MSPPPATTGTCVLNVTLPNTVIADGSRLLVRTKTQVPAFLLPECGRIRILAVRMHHQRIQTQNTPAASCSLRPCSHVILVGLSMIMKK
jgi:hypothetical protein